MRLKFSKLMLIIALLGNIIIWHKIYKLFTVDQNNGKDVNGRQSPDQPQRLHRRLARLVTVVIRQFESFENNIATTVRSVLNAFPVMTIIIVCDDILYPPLELNFKNDSMKNVHLINLQPSFNKSFDERNPLTYIRTKYVLFLPDSTKLLTKQTLQVLILCTF